MMEMIEVRTDEERRLILELLDVPEITWHKCSLCGVDIEGVPQYILPPLSTNHRVEILCSIVCLADYMERSGE